MDSAHPEVDLLPYLRHELVAADRERVAAHLDACPPCRATLESYAAIVAALRAAPAEPPAVDWVRYRAELRRKLDARSRVRLSSPRWVPISGAALAAAAALLLVLRIGSNHGGSEDPMPQFEQVALGSQLDLLQNISVVENLDLLEDLDVVQGLAAGDDGTMEAG